MKIAHVLTTLDIGGAERHALSLSRALCAAGDRVTVFVVHHGTRLERAFRDAGAEVERLEARSTWGLRRASRRLRVALQRGGFDLVHSHLLRGDLVARWAVGDRWPHLRAQHNDEKALLRPWIAAGYRRWLAGTGPVFVPSEHVGRFLVAHGREDPACLRVMPYGCEAPRQLEDEERSVLRRSWGLPEGEQVRAVLILARLAPQKGQLAFLEAISEYAPRADWRIVCVGEDPSGAEQRRLFEALARSPWRGSFHLAGVSTDPADALGAADILLVPSLWEGFGLVALEGMRAGLPIVASDLPALREVLGDAAHFVPAGQGQEALVALDRLARDPIARERASRGATARGELFTEERMVRGVRALYEEILETVRGNHS